MCRGSLRIAGAALLILIVSGFSPLNADTKGRGAVKDYAFDFEPAPAGDNGLPALKVCVLPIINSSDLDRHTKNLKKALRNIEDDEVPRIVGIRYNGYGKPLNRFLIPEPFEVTIAAALEAELEALGIKIVPSSGMDPPENLRERTLAEIVPTLPDGDIPDLLFAIDIDDFYFETRPGFTKIKMETFFVLDVAVLDVATGEIIWDGLVEAGEMETKGMVMGKDAVENRLDNTFRVLIEGVARNNEGLRAALVEQE